MKAKYISKTIATLGICALTAYIFHLTSAPYAIVILGIIAVVWLEV